MPASVFFDSFRIEARHACLPDWWKEFDLKRLDRPVEALKIFPVGCEWAEYGRGAVALQWGHRDIALASVSLTPDEVRAYRRAALANAESSPHAALLYSEKAISRALLSGEPLGCILIERAKILNLANQNEKAADVLALEHLHRADLSIRDQAACWSVTGAIAFSLGQDCSAALEGMEKIGRQYKSRNFAGHRCWFRGKVEGHTEHYVDAMTAFGVHFPRETALVGIELYELDPASGALGFAAQILAKNRHFGLVSVLENGIATCRSRSGSVEKMKEAICRKWSRRSRRLLLR